MEEILDEAVSSLYTMKGKILICLREIRDREEPITAKDIQEKFNIAKSTVSEYLSELEKLNLIERTRNGKNKHISAADF